MPRRNAEKSVFEEAAEVFQELPWRVGAVTALVLVAIGWVLPLVLPSEGLTGPFMVTGRFLLWVLAAVVAVGAAVGATRRSGNRRLFDSKRSVDDLTWSEFEGYLAEYFRRRGAAVTYRGGASADGGVDLVLDDPSGRRIVQAKHWKSRSVGVETVRALWGVLSDEGANGAVVVTSGDFSREATRYAEGKRLELIDGTQLLHLIAEVKGSGTPAAHAAASTESCPQCGRGVLVKKLARRGRNAGSYFLGCDRYPDCQYGRDL